MNFSYQTIKNLLLLLIMLVFFEHLTAQSLVSQKFDAEVLSYETRINCNNSLRTLTTVSIKINNRNGDKYTRILIPYSKINKVSGINATITNLAGATVKSLKTSEVNSRSDISEVSFYEDSYVYEFELSHNLYPYILTYSYSNEALSYLEIAHWIPVVDLEIPTITAKLFMFAPINFNVKYKELLINPCKVEVGTAGTTYSWETNYNGTMKSQCYSVPVYTMLPQVEIVPVKFNYSKPGEFTDWKTFGNWNYSLLENTMDLSEHEKNYFRSVTINISDKKEKISSLYKKMQQETRYVNVSIEKGGFKPYPASYVHKNKYGDCKALSVYFKAILDAIGIESFYTLVYANEKIPSIDKNFPSQQFNHAILCVPMETDTLWIDCTSKNPFGYISNFIRNRDALIIKENNSRFAKIPPFDTTFTTISRTIRVGKDLTNTAIIVTKQSSGDLFETLWFYNQAVNNSDKMDVIKRYLLEPNMEFSELNSLTVNDSNYFVRINYRATSDYFYKSFGNDLIIKHLPFRNFDFETPTQRVLPVLFSHPINLIDTVYYNIPTGYTVNQLPENSTQKSVYGNYKVEFRRTSENIILIKQLTIFPGNYDLAAYSPLFAFFKSVKQIENKLVFTATKN